VIAAFTVRLWDDRTATETVVVVDATTPDEALTMAERQGHNYTEAEVNDARGQQVAVFVDESEWEEDEPDERCSNPDGHQWVYTGTQYGGDDERWGGEGRVYCAYCGADGDA
jgi:hypothetical protein